MATWAYNYTNEELLEGFSRAVARAGVSCSGLVVSATASLDKEEALYLKGVLLARLEGKRPPIPRGTLVELKEHAPVQGFHYKHPKLERGKTYTVIRVYYEIGEREWLVALDGVEGGRYYLTQFDYKADEEGLS